MTFSIEADKVYEIESDRNYSIDTRGRHLNQSEHPPQHTLHHDTESHTHKHAKNFLKPSLPSSPLDSFRDPRSFSNDEYMGERSSFLHDTLRSPRHIDPHDSRVPTMFSPLCPVNQLEYDSRSHSFFPPSLSRSLSDVGSSTRTISASTNAEEGRFYNQRPVMMKDATGSLSEIIQFPEDLKSSISKGNISFPLMYPILSETPATFNHHSSRDRDCQTERRSLSIPYESHTSTHETRESIGNRRDYNGLYQDEQSTPQPIQPYQRGTPVMEIRPSTSYAQITSDVSIPNAENIIARQEQDILMLRHQLAAYERIQRIQDTIFLENRTDHLDDDLLFKSSKSKSTRDSHMKDLVVNKWRAKIFQLLFQSEMNQHEIRQLRSQLERRDRQSMELEDQVRHLTEELRRAQNAIGALGAQNDMLHSTLNQVNQELEQERLSSHELTVALETTQKNTMTKWSNLMKATHALKESVMERVELLESRVLYAMERMNLAQALFASKNKDMVNMARKIEFSQSELSQLRQDRRLLLERLAKAEWPKECSSKQTQTASDGQFSSSSSGSLNDFKSRANGPMSPPVGIGGSVGMNQGGSDAMSSSFTLSTSDPSGAVVAGAPAHDTNAIVLDKLKRLQLLSERLLGGQHRS